MTKPLRLGVIVEGFTAFRVIPHKSDVNKLVLKTGPHMVPAVKALCENCKVPTFNEWQGSEFYIIEVDKMRILETLMDLANGNVEPFGVNIEDVLASLPKQEGEATH